MKIGILGRTSWLLNTARSLAAGVHDLAFVATAAASPEYGATVDDFKSFAETQDCPFHLIDRDTKSSLNGFIRDAAPDVVLSVNWPWILNDETCGIPRLGAFNAHPGDLPRYRGNACPNWAIINGEAQIGLCIHQMVPGEVDSGPVYFRSHLKNGPDLYIENVYEWLAKVIPEGFSKALERLEDPTFRPSIQKENKALPLRCHPRRPSDGEINWSDCAERIQRLVRASSAPFAGAFSYLEGKRQITIWRARIAVMDHDLCAMPGQIAGRAEDGAIRVVCGQGVLEMEQVETDNGGPLSASNKYRLGPKEPQYA